MTGNDIGKNKVNLTVSIHVDEQKIIKTLVRLSRTQQSDLIRDLYLDAIKVKWPEIGAEIQAIRDRQFEEAEAQHLSDLPIKGRKGRPLSSSTTRALITEGDDASVAAGLGSLESEQTRIAGAPIGHTPEQAHGARKDSSKKPEPPKQAPK